ncbi:(2Fe-2S) ferredoxin domain-containing protein [Bremerella sp. T1]|uniref:(2Fe-2S) ferredoxin domain-containing protein n=1 Tax=Bremerella sp. TYQ1 TaxID=3119568 RepID=UPI001CC9EDD1|nr:(2Fe-2S) ferredoxin domain-containing protein [Bremerella volcania]UBM35493.1 (2Fe-2S) ferredoxin domain-containing protein [Bremerella volcania]
MSKFTHHIFVCNKCKPPKHLRDGKSHDSGKIRAALKKEIKRLGLKAQVRANDSGCLDQCDDGQVIVIYPQAIWYGGVTEADVERIIHETILEGKILEDLQIPSEKLRCGKAAKKADSAPSAPSTSS